MTNSAKGRAKFAIDTAWARGSAGVARLRNRGMTVLLAMLVCFVFVLPALKAPGAAWRLALDAALVLILVSGVVAVVEHRRLAIALGAFSGFVIVLVALEWITPIGLLPVLRIVATMTAFLLLACAVGINVFASGRAIGERVFGAIVLYLLLGLIWGVAYAALRTHAPGSFSGHADAEGILADWVYFSFVTLTTVGYGDITPVTTGARSLAMLEALVGQLYPAVIIARLVSLQAEAR